MVEVHMDTRNNEAASFTSIGKLGVSRRSDERLYVNATRFSPDSGEFCRNFRRLVEIGRRNRSRVGRVVFRGLVSEEVVGQALNSDLKDNLEVALPVGEFTGDNSWLVYMAQNKPERTVINPPEYMMNKVVAQEAQETKEKSPLEQIREAVRENYVIIDRITEDQVEQVYSLWGETFGWEREAVDNLRRRLEADNFVEDPSEKQVWFSAVSKDGEIIGVAMAERLSVPGADGKSLDLVESTEWKVKDGHGRNGIMAVVLSALNAQVLSDLKNSRNGKPLIFAECNFLVRADRTGSKAGFRTPERIVKKSRVRQILEQNVTIGDGSNAGKGLRDFNFMHLPVRVVEEYYGLLQLEEMRQAIRHNDVKV
ncbi:MAG: hypothetical protein A3C22_01435 [Candidatus Levybacteria bacterium RIFCSPHIGHO2_02_FULL_37_10]|nr:MAG: hypothetical protein A3C22_01435 [Candidatus Levybacteria bacterium RIFCSPHIGHO2_02_FULL_37_10]OGH41538.1 MAG: hypothetical protein A3H79_04115 [Candidatus Levybacteria bacterium RIFCSPLOWO2_02_FULL_36_8b]